MRWNFFQPYINRNPENLECTNFYTKRKENARDSVAEVATLLGISTGKVYYGISAGKIPAMKQHQGWFGEILIDDFNLESIKALYT